MSQVTITLPDGSSRVVPAGTPVRVAGVAVGHETIVRGSGKLEIGKGPVRTGVTAIFPRGRDDLTPVFAGWFNLNGNGEMTGTAWIDDNLDETCTAWAAFARATGIGSAFGTVTLAGFLCTPLTRYS